MLLTILSLLGQVLPVILANAHIIGPGTQTLIASLTAPVAGVLATVTSGGTRTQDTLAALGAMQGVINVLKGTPNMPAETLTTIGNVEADVQAALAAYVKAEGGLDLTVYQQIAPIA